MFKIVFIAQLFIFAIINLIMVIGQYLLVLDLLKKPGNNFQTFHHPI